MTEPDPTIRMPIADPATSAVGDGAPPVTPPPPPSPAPPVAGWAAPRERPRDDGRGGTIIVGIVLLAVGLWFFADQTLDLQMPDVEWGRFWPLILVGIGAWLVLGALGRRRS